MNSPYQAPEPLSIRNPRTGEYDYQLEIHDGIDITQFTRRARRVQGTWNSSGLSYRIEVMQKWISAIEEEEEALVEQLSIDTGRVKVARLEVKSILGLMRGWCFRAPQVLQESPTRPSANNPKVHIIQQLIPYPVVGVISPWNFPLLLGMIDTIPALLAGSTVLLKPSEVTPRFIAVLERTIAAVPELKNVIRLVRGGAEAGKFVVLNVDAICFTGSVATGKAIAQICAERFIPAFLELGGKDPAIVLADADLESATDAILRSAVGVSGQACQSIERVYVEVDIFPAFLDMIIAKAKAVTLNAEEISRGHLGPIIFEQQAHKIQAQIDNAVAHGAVIQCGGQVEQIGGGWWCAPTVLSGVHSNMELMKEETFGPLIPVIPFQGIEMALQLANDSRFGLSGSVFSQDIEKAKAIAASLEVGAVSINDGSLTNQVFDAEKNSFKDSGINGSRMGDAGLLRFLRKKAILIQTATPQSIDDMAEEV